MSGDLRALLTVGTRLAYDGQWWQVTEIDGPHVLLSSPGGVRRVSAGHLLADPSARLDGAPGDPVEGAGADLAGLGETEIAELRERVAHVREVRTGFRRGCAELAADGEPRPEFGPGVPMLARYAARASEIGVGVSTLRRWVKDFGSPAPPGWPMTGGGAAGSPSPGRTRAGLRWPGRYWPSTPRPASPPAT